MNVEPCGTIYTGGKNKHQNCMKNFYNNRKSSLSIEFVG